MLPENKEIKADAPSETVRLRFRKVGNLQYISHLDLQRTFNRIIKRAGIPVWYTKGFNPHPKLVFAMPLSVGTQSECELLDLKIIKGSVSCEELMERFNSEMTEELCITGAYIPTTKFSDIGWAEYSYVIYTAGAGEQTARVLQTLYTTGRLVLTKRTKSGEKDTDIIPLIRSAEVRYCPEDGAIRIRAVLRAASAEFLNPEMLITGAKQKSLILCGDPMEEHYDIVRTDILTEKYEKFE